MAYDRFLIAPFRTGLLIKASLWYDHIYTEGFNYMKMRKDTIDLTGKVFTQLTVLRPYQDDCRGMKWLCLCICGKETIAYGGHLRAGKRKSCGCMAEQWIEETGVNKIFSMYKCMAQKRNHEFLITRDDLHKLIKDICTYCGTEPSQILTRQKSKKVQIIYNGIDRFDTDRGYIPGNCVTACFKCNLSKHSMTFDAWKNHIRKIYKWLMIDS